MRTHLMCRSCDAPALTCREIYYLFDGGVEGEGLTRLGMARPLDHPPGSTYCFLCVAQLAHVTATQVRANLGYWAYCEQHFYTQYLRGYVLSPDEKEMALTGLGIGVLKDFRSYPQTSHYTLHPTVRVWTETASTARMREADLFQNLLGGWMVVGVGQTPPRRTNLITLDPTTPRCACNRCERIPIQGGFRP